MMTSASLTRLGGLGLLLAGLMLAGCSTPQSSIDKAMEEARTDRERSQTSDQHDDAMDRMERRRQQQ